MKKISILINTPHLHKRGGVSNHYKGLKGFWKQDVRYHTVGSRHGISGLLWMMPDTLLFVLKLAFIKPDIVLLNPSLQLNALKRDALYLKVSKYLKIPTCIFMHGWEVEVENAIDNKEFNFYEKYKKADAFLVLANDFKLKLKQWGVNAPIYLTTTKVDDKLIENLKISYDKTNKTILFLSRIEENKGILIVLKVFKEILKKHPDAKLKIAGNGGALKKVKRNVSNEQIPNIDFLGNVSGDNLIGAFRESSIYILPTTHGEGMPTSILEAMAFGLPIISRPVGGLVDFFEEDKMGYLLESLQPEEYSEKMIQLLENHEKYKAIGTYNHEYAKEYFMASKVALKIEKQLFELL
jgi:glycosyltransferase involved in cell wall biosynthesis